MRLKKKKKMQRKLPLIVNKNQEHIIHSSSNISVTNIMACVKKELKKTIVLKTRVI